MKAEKISIKWKLILYMTLFVAVEFILMSAFHMFFLDNFYRNIKVNELKSAAKSIMYQLDSEDMDALLKSTSREGGMCIEIFEEDGTEKWFVAGMPFGVIHDMSISDRQKLFEETMEEGTKIYFETMNFYGQHKEQKNPEGDKDPGFDKALTENDASQHEGAFSFTDAERIDENPDIRRDVQDVLILSQAAQMNGEDVVIVLSTALTPLFATREILNVETMYVCAVMLVVSILLAVLIYRKISRPIMNTNKTAMSLAGGNYDVKFESNGYREIRELNDTLTFAASELNKTESLRRDLMANISHDLRTPLTMIRGYAELMRDIPGENNSDNLQIIIDETNRLSNLVTDILDISKLQSGVMKLNETEFSITDTIKAVLNRYRKLKELEGYKIEFESDKNVYIKADAIKMSQVVYNLLNNAINYTGDDKKITVRQIIKDRKVRIEIEDTGEGIDPKDIKFIWDRYYKVDKTHKRPVSGTGLGLSIVKNILELHGFDYGVISDKGKGSVFYFQADISKIDNI